MENEDLNVRLRRSEEVLLRVKEELARYRSSFGKDPCIDFDEEEQLRMKLQVCNLLVCCKSNKLSEWLPVNLLKQKWVS